MYNRSGREGVRATSVRARKSMHVGHLSLSVHTVPGCYNCCVHPRSTSRCMLILICNHRMAPLLVDKVISQLLINFELTYKSQTVDRSSGNMVTNVCAKSMIGFVVRTDKALGFRKSDNKNKNNLRNDWESFWVQQCSSSRHVSVSKVAL